MAALNLSAGPVTPGRLQEIKANLSALPAPERYQAQLNLANGIASIYHIQNEMAEAFYDYVVQDGSWRHAGLTEATFQEEFATVKQMADQAKSQRDRLREARSKITERWGPHALEMFPSLTTATAYAALWKAA